MRQGPKSATHDTVMCKSHAVKLLRFVRYISWRTPPEDVAAPHSEPPQHDAAVDPAFPARDAGLRADNGRGKIAIDIPEAGICPLARSRNQ